MTSPFLRDADPELWANALRYPYGLHVVYPRASQDDQEAISINFQAPLYEENRLYRDDRPDLFKFNGAKGLAEVRLEKEEPMQFQEIDIVLLLQRVFKPENIYHSPKREGFPRLRFGVRDLFDEDGSFRFK